MKPTPKKARRLTSPFPGYHAFPRDFKVGFIKIKKGDACNSRRLSLSNRKRQSFSAQPCLKHQQKKVLTC